jgi:hypothetical protein
MEQLPSFLGGAFTWDADWIPAKVRNHEELVEKKRERKPSFLNMHKTPATATATPGASPKKAFNPFSSASK